MANSSSSVLRITMFYCLIIGMGLLLLSLSACYCNHRLKSVILFDDEDLSVVPTPHEDYPVASVIYVNNQDEIMNATVIEISPYEQA